MAASSKPIVAERFRLEERLEHDARVAVWRGTDTADGSRVRILRISGPVIDAALDGAVRAGVLDDPRIPEQLAVVRPTDHDPGGYVVTRAVEGRRLSEMLGQTTLSARRARAVVGAVSGGIAAAEAAGVHHGHLRPRHVVIRDDDSVVVLDIGVAGALAEVDDEDAAAADLQSLYALLYASMTGRWPAGDSGPRQDDLFDTDTAAEDVGLPPAPVVRGATVPPAEVAPGVPHDLSQLCADGLAHRARGMRTAADLAERLSAAERPRVDDGQDTVAMAAIGPADDEILVEPQPVAMEPEVTSRPEGVDPEPRIAPAATAAEKAPGPNRAAPQTDRESSDPEDGETAPQEPAQAPKPRTGLKPAFIPSARPHASAWPAAAAVGSSVSGSLEGGQPVDHPPSPTRPDQFSTGAIVSTGSRANEPGAGETRSNQARHALDSNPSRTARAGSAPGRRRVGGAVAAVGAAAEARKAALMTGGSGARVRAAGQTAQRFATRLHPDIPRLTTQEKKSRTRAVVGILSAGMAVALILSIFSISRLFSSQDASASATPSPAASVTTSAPPPVRPVIASVAVDDSLGDEEENDEDAANVLDSDADSTWRSSGYRSAAFGGTKPGLGLLVTLRAPAPLTAVAVSQKGEGGELEIRNAPQGTFEGSTVLGRAEMGTPSTRVAIANPVTTRQFLIWFTEVPELDDTFRLEISAIAVA